MKPSERINQIAKDMAEASGILSQFQLMPEAIKMYLDELAELTPEEGGSDD